MTLARDLNVVSYYKRLSLGVKCALVSSGPRGLGETITTGFADAGVVVVPVARRAEEVCTTAEEIRYLVNKLGGERPSWVARR